MRLRFAHEHREAVQVRANTKAPEKAGFDKRGPAADEGIENEVTPLGERLDGCVCEVR